MTQSTTLTALTLYFYVSLLLTAIVAPVIIALYRRAVLKRMMQRAGSAAVSLPEDSVAATTTRPRFKLVEIGADSAPGQEVGVEKLLTAGRQAKRRLAWVYGIAGFVVSLLFAFLQIHLSELDYTIVRVVAFTLVHAAWVIPTIAIATAMPFARALLVFVLYIAASCAALVLIPMLDHLIAKGQLDLKFINNAAVFLQACWKYLLIPLVLLAVTANRRLRAVAPVIYAALLSFAAAPYLSQKLAESAFEHPQLHWLLLGAGPTGMFLLISVPVGYIAWRFIVWLARLYDNKRFSDVHMLIVAWWLIFIIQQAVELSTGRGQPLLIAGASLAMIATFWLLTALGLRLLRSPAHAAPRLLLLRVFGYQERTERLFDAVGQNWRFCGPVQMIAGPDLAGRTIDPGDLMRFVAGQLDEDFIGNAEQLKQRLGTLDVAPDPDGRFRVNEFFCHDNAWQAALVSLLERSDRVLMDLRGFSHERAGCRFELEQLVSRADPNHVVLVIDETTDEALLRELLAQAGHEEKAAPQLPDSASLWLVRMNGGQETRQRARLLDALLRVAPTQLTTG